MASVMVTTFSKDTYGTFFQGICGNTEAFVTHSHGTVRVCVVNSSHKAFRTGAGKAFKTFEDAVKGYKNPSVKAVIEIAAIMNRA